MVGKLEAFSMQLDNREEYFTRAMIYWHAYLSSNSMKHLDNYYFWYMAYTDGKAYAIRYFLP